VVRFLSGIRDFSVLQNVHNGFVVRLRSNQLVSECLSRLKLSATRETDHTSPSSAEVKANEVMILLPLSTFIACTRTNLPL
jgi:hypothetical protein